MKIADMELGQVYAYNRGHHGRTQPVLMLDFGYYIVTRTDTDVMVQKSTGRQKRLVRGVRGLLAVPAPEEVWELVREGKDIGSLRSIDELYSRYLIITDNLPENGADVVHFSFEEFGDILTLTPPHVPGRLVDQFATEEERQRQRDEKYARQAAEEKARRDAFGQAQAKASQLGATTVHFFVNKNSKAKAQMSAEDFILLMELVPAKRKR